MTVRNLTDEYTRFRAAGVPLSSEAGTFSNYPDPPRMLFATFRWAF